MKGIIWIRMMVYIKGVIIIAKVVIIQVMKYLIIAPNVKKNLFIEILIIILIKENI